MAPQPWATRFSWSPATVTSRRTSLSKVRKLRPHRHTNRITTVCRKHTTMVCRKHTTMEHTAGDTARSKVMRFGARETAESILLLCQTVVHVPVAHRATSAQIHARSHVDTTLKIRLNTLRALSLCKLCVESLFSESTLVFF